MRPPLAVIHTADLHGDRRGAHALALVASLREREPQAVWLDSGDAVGTPNITLGAIRAPILDTMGRMGCSAVALGNREFELSAWALRRTLLPDAPPLVCTNLTHPWPEKAPVRSELTLRTPQGAQVRVFALLRDMTRDLIARMVSEFRFLDPEEALAQALHAAAPGPDEWVVVLSHLGREADEALFERLARVDLVLGGHSHEEYVHVEGGRACCAPAPYGGSVAMVRAEGALGSARVSVELVPSDGGRGR